MSSTKNTRELLEKYQVGIYLGSVLLAIATALAAPGSDVLEPAINPALAAMLFLTFLQVPLAELGRAFVRGRFLAALLTANFVAVPLLVGALVPLLPSDEVLRLGVLLVLLAPCVDYVVTFSQIGRADARLLLAATPTLLIVQMVLLPVYLAFLLGSAAAMLVQAGPFVEAFVWLIASPLVLAAIVQGWAARKRAGSTLLAALTVLPVPATALVLFIVVAAVLPQLGSSWNAALQVTPFYIAFAVIAPLLGWATARLFRLDASAARAIAFSTGTRNSLVVLPLALAVPGAMPMLPAIIVTQTLIELVAELFYVRWIARFGGADAVAPPPPPGGREERTPGSPGS